jgi:hypothetical protein
VCTIQYYYLQILAFSVFLDDRYRTVVNTSVGDPGSIEHRIRDKFFDTCSPLWVLLNLTDFS